MGVGRELRSPKQDMRVESSGIAHDDFGCGELRLVFKPVYLFLIDLFLDELDPLVSLAGQGGAGAIREKFKATARNLR